MRSLNIAERPELRARDLVHLRLARLERLHLVLTRAQPLTAVRRAEELAEHLAGISPRHGEVGHVSLLGLAGIGLQIEQLIGIERAMYASGRHVLIHGLRGVGKSSLAQTAAHKIARGGDPIIVSCDKTSTFQTIIRELLDEAIWTCPGIVPLL